MIPKVQETEEKLINYTKMENLRAFIKKIKGQSTK